MRACHFRMGKRLPIGILELVNSTFEVRSVSVAIGAVHVAKIVRLSPQ